MKQFKTLVTLLIVTSLLLLAACGSDSNEGTGGTEPAEPQNQDKN